MRIRKYCLVVHNSDVVKAVFVGELHDLMTRVMQTSYGNDIEKRSLEYYNDDMSADNERWVNRDEIPLSYLTEHAEALLDRLYHDGDSEDGYTLFNTEMTNQSVLFFRDN